MTMPRNKLIQERIELRRWQPWIGSRAGHTFSKSAGRSLSGPSPNAGPMIQVGTFEVVIMRIHLAGVIFKVSSISRVRSEDEHCHYGAAALTRNELALDHFLGFRRARRQIDRSDVFTSSAHNRFHLACQFEPQGFEDCRPLRGHWVGWITNHFAGNMAAPIIQFL